MTNKYEIRRIARYSYEREQERTGVLATWDALPIVDKKQQLREARQAIEQYEEDFDLAQGTLQRI